MSAGVGSPSLGTEPLPKPGPLLALAVAAFLLCGCLAGCSGEAGSGRSEAGGQGAVFAPSQLDASDGPAGAEEQISYIVGNAGQALPAEDRPSRVMQLGVDAEWERRPRRRFTCRSGRTTSTTSPDAS